MSIDLMRDKPVVGVPIGQGANGSGAQLQPVNPAYNTYVGARYVPIFAGEWDATKTYEPLTIVMWQGNSYTSKTFVPAQTEISNEDFWALTGNYNAQVELYRQEVTSLKQTVINNNFLSMSPNLPLYKAKCIIFTNNLSSTTPWYERYARDFNGTLISPANPGVVNGGYLSAFNSAVIDNPDSISYVLVSGTNEDMQNLSLFTAASQTLQTAITARLKNASVIYLPMYLPSDNDPYPAFVEASRMMSIPINVTIQKSGPLYWQNGKMTTLLDTSVYFALSNALFKLPLIQTGNVTVSVKAVDGITVTNGFKSKTSGYVKYIEITDGKITFTSTPELNKWIKVATLQNIVTPTQNRLIKGVKYDSTGSAAFLARFTNPTPYGVDLNVFIRAIDSTNSFSLSLNDVIMTAVE